MMKRITLLWCLTICLTANLSAQTVVSELDAERAAQLQQQSVTSTTTVEDLITRLTNLESQAGLDMSTFTATERQILNRHFRLQNREVLSDIIPTAGEVETFIPATGDFFFDTGGPGGSNDTSGASGNYTSCGCVTRTTLAGVYDVEFLYFEVFAAYDWLKIYDGPDTTVPVLFDNSLGGINELDRTLEDMIASNGSGSFVGTSGAITFEFNATSVIDRGGWEVEIITTGPVVGNTVFALDGGSCSDDFGSFSVDGPFDIEMVTTTISPLFAGVFDDLGVLYAADTSVDQLITINPATGTETVVGPFTNLVTGEGMSGLAWNRDDQTMYAYSTNSSSSTLYTLDATTGTLTVVGTSSLVLGVWLAIDNDGNAYTMSIDDDSLYSVNLFDGSTTLIGPTGISSNFAQDADFDSDSGILYAGIYTGGGVNQFASIDTATGVATVLGTVNSDCAELTVVAIKGTIPPPPPPANDYCSGAIPLTCGESFVGETFSDSYSGGNPAPDEFFSFTGTGDAEWVTFSLCNGGTFFDSVLRVFEDCTLANEIAVNDDECGLQSELTFESDGTSTYYIMVDGYDMSSGEFSLEVSCTLLSTNENKIEGFKYYPNPAATVINLNAQEHIERVSIYNVLGQKVVDQNINAMSSQLDVDHLTAGTYLMKVTVNGQEGVYRIIKN